MSKDKKRGFYDNIASILKASKVSVEEFDDFLNARLQKESVTQEAHRLINGQKRAAYGPVYTSFSNIAKVASIAIRKDLTPKDIALIMVSMKLCRESNAHNRDNLVDICGYADLAMQLVATEGQNCGQPMYVNIKEKNPF